MVINVNEYEDLSHFTRALVADQLGEGTCYFYKLFEGLKT